MSNKLSKFRVLKIIGRKVKEHVYNDLFAVSYVTHHPPTYCSGHTTNIFSSSDVIKCHKCVTNF